METVELNGKQYEVTGHAADGLPIIKGTPTTVHHKDENGNQIFDKDGIPKISVNIDVPPIVIGVIPGKNG